MAERRMFAKTIVTSDAFLDMPLSARCLYFTLGMFADDDGFVNNPKSVMRQTGASNDDLNLLIAKRFVLTFESGVIVIKHWKIHNYIAKDRYKETKYLAEKNTLSVDQNGAYTECIQDVYKLETQVSIGQGRLSQYRVVEGSANVDENNGNGNSRAERAEFSPEENELLKEFPDLDLDDKDAVEEAKKYKEQQKKFFRMTGTLGKGVVYLTPEQQDELLEILGLDGFNFYVEKLANFIIEKNANVANHFATILKWWKEDTKV